jgi:predicted permease
MATAVLVTELTMVVYNILAVVVLQGSNHSTKGSDWRQLARSIATNPHYYFFTVACRH